jgi:predicted DNA binding protein
MIEATVRVTLPCGWVTLVAERYGARISVVEQKPLREGLLQSLVEIDPGSEDPGRIVDELRRTPDIARVEAVVPEAGKILATLQVRECHACQAISDSECFLTDAVAAPGGGLEWHLLGPTREALEALVSGLRGRGLAVEVAAVRSVKSKGLLTDRQKRVLDIAYRLGYYDIPKKIDLSRLAEKLGVAKSTLSEMLRTGEAKILHTYFHGLLRRPR